MKTSGSFAPWQNELADKREFKEISQDIGYWHSFWIWKNDLPENKIPYYTGSNVVNIKEAAHG